MPYFFSFSTLQKSNGCPLLLPMFSSATLLYLWLTQFPGWIHPAVWRLEQGNVLQTDGQTEKHTSQRAYVPLLCPLECPPTPITRIASVSSYLSQTRFLLLLFARDGCRSGWAYCTLLTSCSPTVLFTVRFVLLKEPETQPLSHPFILYSQGEKKKPDKYIRVRKVDSLIFFPKSSEMQPVCVYLATSRHNDLIHLCKVHLENKRFVLERLNAVILVHC